MPKKFTLLLDFDSTIIQAETLDELAKIALQKYPQAQRDAVVKQIESLTNAGMEGTLSIEDSLTQRIALLDANKTDVETVTAALKTKLSPSFLLHKEFFKQHTDQIYVVSAGFTECIQPITDILGLRPDHIFANRFIYNPATLQITGIDKSLPLAQTKGKVKAVKSLNLSNTQIHALGDGYTDCEIKLEGAADYFFAYTETIRRENAIKNADFTVGNFSEYLQKAAELA